MHIEVLGHRRPPLGMMDPTADVLVCLLGNFRLLRRGEPLNLLIAGKAMALLSQLALHLNSGVPREGLLEILWPEQDAAHSMVSLNSLVYSVQRRLRDSTRDAPAVIYSNGRYSLNAAAGVSTDVAQFDTLADRGNRLAAAGQESAATLYYRHAIELYRGDLCTGD